MEPNPSCYKIIGSEKKLRLLEGALLAIESHVEKFCPFAYKEIWIYVANQAEAGNAFMDQ